MRGDTVTIHQTDIEDVFVIEPRIFGDDRGWFIETYSKEKYKALGIDVDFVQDNHSMSKNKGTLRGLHFQLMPKAQTKLVRCTRGKVWDVVVDLRKGSPTYKKWIGCELSEDNKKQLLIPKGCAHGFLTLTDDVEVQYKVDTDYAPDYDRSIRYDDPEIGVAWGVAAPILSEKDLSAPLLKASDANFSLKFMVTGADGQLGYEIVAKLKSLHMDVIAPGIEMFDLTQKEQIKAYILKEKPNVVIHCAAYTAVDQAEDEKALCYAVNVEGTQIIAESAKAINAKLVYVSTDYVFDGLGEAPHTENQEMAPINYYGYTKAQGEKIIREILDHHFIVRTSWLYGVNGRNFVKTMLQLAESRREICVVRDQIGAPTYAKDLAEWMVELVQTRDYGTYHGVNEGACSWYEFAKSIFEKSGLPVSISPIDSQDYPTKAKRPLNSRLSKANIDRAGLKRLPHWEDALSRFLTELKEREAKE